MADRAANSFEVLAREWFAKHVANWSDSHTKRIGRFLEGDLFPWLGAQPIADITAHQVLTVVQRVERRGALPSAHRVLQVSRRRCWLIARAPFSSTLAGLHHLAELSLAYGQRYQRYDTKNPARRDPGGKVAPWQFKAELPPFPFLSKLVVTKPPDMRLFVKQMPKSRKPILVPSQCIGYGIVPNAPHFALAVAVLRHFRLRRGLPAASQPVNEVAVGEIGQADRLQARRSVLWKCQLPSGIAQQLQSPHS